MRAIITWGEISDTIPELVLFVLLTKKDNIKVATMEENGKYKRKMDFEINRMSIFENQKNRTKTKVKENLCLLIPRSSTNSSSTNFNGCATLTLTYITWHRKLRKQSSAEEKLNDKVGGGGWSSLLENKFFSFSLAWAIMIPNGWDSHVTMSSHCVSSSSIFAWPNNQFFLLSLSIFFFC